MGAGFGRDPHSARLAPGNDVHGERSGNVGNVHGQLQVLGQHDVARGLYGLARRRLALDAQQPAGHALVHAPAPGQMRVFAVVDEGEVEVGRVFHNPAHQLGALQGAAVVGHGHAARSLKLGQRGQFLALEPHAGCGHGVEARAVGVAVAGALQHKGGDAGRIVDRPGVGHAHDRAKAAARCRLQTGGDVFLIFIARFAQVSMRVRKTGHEGKALGLKNFAAFRRRAVSGRGHGQNFAVFDQQVHRGFQVAGIFDAKFHARPPSRRVASR